MSDQGSSKSWGSTVLIGVIIFVLIVVAIIIIYYVFTLPQRVPFPVSPFNYGDVIQICPAVFTQDFFDIKNSPQNQYLRITSGSDCQHPNDGYGQPGTCIASFTGNKAEKETKWVLQNSYNSICDCSDCPAPENCPNGARCSTCPNMLAQQNFLEFGNRFYLQNIIATSPSDTSALLTYWSLENGIVPRPWNSSVTFPVTGNTYIPIYTNQTYDQPLVVYFLPTTQPDIYYILFPGQNYLWAPPLFNPNSLSTNDAIMSLRAFSQPNQNAYNPWNNNNLPNPNGLLLNSLNENYVSADKTAIGTNKPNIFLFKITKAAV